VAAAVVRSAVLLEVVKSAVLLEVVTAAVWALAAALVQSAALCEAAVWVPTACTCTSAH
jgi:hypothetical protein